MPAFRLKPGGAQFAKCCSAEQAGEEKAIRSERATHLNERAGQVVSRLEGEKAYDAIERFGRQRKRFRVKNQLCAGRVMRPGYDGPSMPGRIEFANCLLRPEPMDECDREVAPDYIHPMTNLIGNDIGEEQGRLSFRTAVIAAGAGRIKQARGGFAHASQVVELAREFHAGLALC